MGSEKVIHNVDADYSSNIEEIKLKLVDQLHKPVLWTSTVQKMKESGVEKLIEAGPGKVLAGLTRRIDKSLSGSAIIDTTSLRSTIERYQMLNEKLVLVTGASRGIGRAIALTLGNAGATVIGTATSDEGAANISKIFTENNILGKGMKLNITNNEQISNLFKSITLEYGSVDILINNGRHPPVIISLSE